MNDRNYWAGYWLERLRFDRGPIPPKGGASKKGGGKKRTCQTGYSCGSSCISLKRECLKNSGSSIGKERLRKIEALAGAGSPDAQGIRDRRSAKAGELKDERLTKRVKEALKQDPDLLSKVGQSVSGGRRGTIAEVDPATIAVDPKRFQYKVIGESTATGEVGSLSGVRRYDPNLGGILQVWEDPSDGKTYVINGHNRLALAKRLGAEEVAVRYIKAESPAEARAIGALTNIAEGRGTAVDAAKFFRDTGISREALEDKGIPMREKIATDGLSLSKLPDHLFRRVIDGEMSVERAAIIGGSGLSSEKQTELDKLIGSRERGNRKLTNDTVRELVDTVKASEQRTEFTMDLFGGSQEVKDNAIERAQIQAKIKARLSREKKLFATVGKSRAAQELERAGNQINVEESSNIAREAQFALGLFDQFKNASGPVSSAINAAATAMQQAKTKAERDRIERDLYAQILDELPQMAGFKR